MNGLNINNPVEYLTDYRYADNLGHIDSVFPDIFDFLFDFIETQKV